MQPVPKAMEIWASMKMRYATVLLDDDDSPAALEEHVVEVELLKGSSLMVHTG